MDRYIEEQLSDAVNTFEMKSLSFFEKKFVRSDKKNGSISSLLYTRLNPLSQDT